MPKQTIVKMASGVWRVSTADAMALIEISKRARPVAANRGGEHTYASRVGEMTLAVYTAELPSLLPGVGRPAPHGGEAPRGDEEPAEA